MGYILLKIVVSKAAVVLQLSQQLMYQEITNDIKPLLVLIELDPSQFKLTVSYETVAALSVQ